jgi:hypothetical protein
MKPDTTARDNLRNQLFLRHSGTHAHSSCCSFISALKSRKNSFNPYQRKQASSQPGKQKLMIRGEAKSAKQQFCSAQQNKKIKSTQRLIHFFAAPCASLRCKRRKASLVKNICIARAVKNPFSASFMAAPLLQT